MSSDLRSSGTRAMIRCLLLASLLVAACVTAAAQRNQDSLREGTPAWFADCLGRAAMLPDSIRCQQFIENVVGRLARRHAAIVADSTVYFVYAGHAARVSVPSDLNGWEPAADTMTRFGNTYLFYLRKTLPQAARFEYKLVVDSSWILDPFNEQTATGGFGPNSEIRMPSYSPPTEIVYREHIPHGRIDTIAFASAKLGRTHPVFIYLPPGYENSAKAYAVLFVTDGGEYLSLGLMNNVLDNMIADRRIAPLVAVFLEPRTDSNNSRTSMRMTDYAMSETFLSYLTDELRPFLSHRYRLDAHPARTGIMGASLGALIATYAAIRRPDVFGFCAAQSPAYQVGHDSVFTVVASTPKQAIRFYLDTGTIRDAQEQARKMKRLLQSKGYPVTYAEYPEGHNWVNWRARIPCILTFLGGTQ